MITIELSSFALNRIVKVESVPQTNDTVSMGIYTYKVTGVEHRLDITSGRCIDIVVTLSKPY